jgi:solute carrier family 25 phosphate transporter 3
VSETKDQRRLPPSHSHTMADYYGGKYYDASNDYSGSGGSSSSPNAPPPRARQRWNSARSHPIIHDSNYYSTCLAGGVLSSSNRWFQVPLDVVKCNMQVSPEKYTGMVSGLRILWAEEGLRGMFKGIGPTAAAYALQTGTKYGLYEVLKDEFSTALGEDLAYQYRGQIYVAAAGCAEACASVLMCPFEMLKVRVQTSPSGTFPTSFGPALSHMIANRQNMRFPFGSLVPLWGRQVPSTIANFYTFERVVEFFYTRILTKGKDAYGVSTQLGVTLASGYIAGFVSSVVSHPADSLVSLMAKPSNRGKSMMQIANQVGWVKLATKGLLPRTLLTGTAIGLQWYIYDSFKSGMGMGTTGGVPQKNQYAAQTGK